ncbi:hypothetical protein HA402_014062 [Bradysia odoriphaga]|uniref:Odorant-binding protein 44 n=1 Tax=Bradysia odoriphaga TaxID=1564500 RepID=A0A2S0X9J9_9DIPT|nr:odorant-binding protein 44 [Bradysia odoriphaga]KAG4073857.1 hypothetical protein HA402_014062 [Bradysia odoriphaga]
MKNYISLILMFVLVANGDQEKWSVRTTRDGLYSYNNCVNKLNIPADDVLKIEKISDPLNRQILECVYNDLGFYTEGIGFRVDRIVQQFGGGPVMENVVTMCIPIGSSDPVADQIIVVEECFRMEKVGGYQE